MLSEETKSDSFVEFVTATERRLRQALTSAFGPDRGREAAAEALAYGWEHWDRVSGMENPAGYLYRVGRDRARRMYRTGPLSLPPTVSDGDRWVEPALPGVLAALPEKQRTVVALLYGYGWSMGEVAELLGIAKSTVQTYAGRALESLRRRLGVNR